MHGCPLPADPIPSGYSPRPPSGWKETPSAPAMASDSPPRPNRWRPIPAPTQTRASAAGRVPCRTMPAFDPAARRDWPWATTPPTNPTRTSSHRGPRKPQRQLHSTARDHRPPRRPQPASPTASRRLPHRQCQTACLGNCEKPWDPFRPTPPRVPETPPR